MAKITNEVLVNEIKHLRKDFSDYSKRNSNEHKEIIRRQDITNGKVLTNERTLYSYPDVKRSVKKHEEKLKSIKDSVFYRWFIGIVLTIIALLLAFR